MKFKHRLMRGRQALVLVGLFFVAAAAELKAELKLHALFTEHVVLQRGMPVPVWGEADAGKQVTVDFAGQKVQGKAAANGRWMAVLKSLPANAEGAVMTVTMGDEKLEVKDVLVGEVWLCSGQSNMGWTV